MRVSRTILAVILVVVALVLQVTILARLQLPGAVPDLLLLTVLFISPLVFMVTTSFKTNFEAAQPTWIPKDPTTEGYSFIFNADQTPVLRWFLNSLLAAAGQTVFHLHIHILPRKKGEPLKPPGGKIEDQTKLAATAEKIRKKLA